MQTRSSLLEVAKEGRGGIDLSSNLCCIFLKWLLKPASQRWRSINVPPGKRMTFNLWQRKTPVPCLIFLTFLVDSDVFHVVGLLIPLFIIINIICGTWGVKPRAFHTESYIPIPLVFCCYCWVFLERGFELRAYTLSHSASPILWWFFFFETGSCELVLQAGFKPRPSWSLLLIGMSHPHPAIWFFIFFN
jgi:hypothetical protein